MTGWPDPRYSTNCFGKNMTQEMILVNERASGEYVAAIGNALITNKVAFRFQRLHFDILFNRH